MFAFKLLVLVRRFCSSFYLLLWGRWWAVWAKKTTAGNESRENDATSSNYTEYNTSLLLTAKCNTDHRQQRGMDAGECSWGALMPSSTTNALRDQGQKSPVGQKQSPCTQHLCLCLNQHFILPRPSKQTHPNWCMCVKSRLVGLIKRETFQK